MKSSISPPDLHLPGMPGSSRYATLFTGKGLLSRAWSWVCARRKAQSRSGRLRVAETVSLGEKRFVALIHVDGLQFLVGGGPTNVALLAQLGARSGQGAMFADVFADALMQSPPSSQSASDLAHKEQA